MKPTDPNETTTKSIHESTVFSAGSNPAMQWLDGEISRGKMLNLCGVPRLCGDDLVGAIWNAFRDKIDGVERDLKQNRHEAELHYKDSLDRGNLCDAAADSARMRAYTEALSIVRFYLTGCIERTTASK